MSPDETTSIPIIPSNRKKEPCLFCNAEDCYPDECEVLKEYLTPRPMSQDAYLAKWDEEAAIHDMPRCWSNIDVYRRVINAGPHENFCWDILKFIDKLHLEMLHDPLP